ncbi:hypothetical protein BDE36_1793 [Arcticibacter tournemirensis]|uniref:Uncharacterized protein n=1 Tax=Arcticibacter tournemirensis TaxID=699437 RepID=A0A5M9H9Y5_9SPHI|nr:hypothetical protein [Arcticibacter tournemirensis]KAA8483743.1 hypothetical protein F1649_07595 [Arcticibacter tournemirensis]TQM50058.1 hypothetical protein BDE36_1793 [Arcticibacter tournemirensis]
MVNPSLNSKWQAYKGKDLITYQVTAIWGKGFLAKYRVESYELTPVAGGDVQTVAAEKMRELK